MVVGAAFAIASAPLAAPPASAAESRPIDECSPSGYYGTGEVISGDSYLTRDLSCAKGFVLVAGATLDLRGHTLTGLPDPLSCVGCPDAPVYEQPGHAGVVLVDGHVVNGALDQWESGVRVLAQDPASGVRRSVSRLSLTANGIGVNAINNADLVSVSHSVFTRNGTGMSAYNGGGFVVDGSTFRANTGSGIEMINSQDLTVRRSVFSHNGAWGLFTIDATGVGVLTNNLFYANQAGLVIGEGGQSLTLQRNFAMRNETAGILVTYEESQVQDLGGNRAWQNGDEPQCTGVSCGR